MDVSSLNLHQDLHQDYDQDYNQDYDQDYDQDFEIEYGDFEIHTGNYQHDYHENIYETQHFPLEDSNPETSHPLPNDFELQTGAFADLTHFDLHNGPRTLSSRYVVTQWGMISDIYYTVDVFICFNLDDALARFNDIAQTNIYFASDNDIHPRYSFTTFGEFNQFRASYPHSFIASIQSSNLFIPYFNELRFIRYNTNQQFGISIQLLN
jgi:hypothetical protein